jgi:hypothetical protein
MICHWKPFDIKKIDKFPIKSFAFAPEAKSCYGSPLYAKSFRSVAIAKVSKSTHILIN